MVEKAAKSQLESPTLLARAPKPPRKTSFLVLVLGTGVLLSIFWHYGTEAKKALDEVKLLETKKGELNAEKDTISKERYALEMEVRALAREKAILLQELDEARNAMEQLSIDYENAPPEVVIKQVLASSRGKSARGQAMALYTAGRLALEQRRTERAEALFTASVEHDAGYAPALTVLGRLRAPTDRPEAERLYRAAIAADPTYKFAWHNLAHLLHIEQKNLEALEMTERTLRIDPQFDSAKKLKALIEAALFPKPVPG